MLHEVLLALSGHPSPLFDDSYAEKFPHIAPAEASLLKSIGRLAALHRALRSHLTRIYQTHPSLICRAVAHALLSRHLAAFQRAISAFENGLLRHDASEVGAYDIVPLATVVSSFSEWHRRLEWFWSIATFMSPDGMPTVPATGSALMSRLRQEFMTGYPDIETIVVNVLEVAHTAWLKQLSTFLFLGRPAESGSSDFFIKDDSPTKDSLPTLQVVTTSLPDFLSLDAAASILYIGKTLQYINQSGQQASLGSHSRNILHSSQNRLEYVKILSSLHYPLSESSLNAAISAIRTSLSNQLVHGVLPVKKIVDTLLLMTRFLFLQRIDFTDSLIDEADKHLRVRYTQTRSKRRTAAASDLTSIMMQEGEVSSVLNKTWASIASAMGRDQTIDPDVEWAREHLRLRLKKADSVQSTTGNGSMAIGLTKQLQLPTNVFDDFLLSAPLRLDVDVGETLSLFLDGSDIEAYSVVNAYLIAIRRSLLHLTDMWRQGFLRKGGAFSPGPQSSYKYRMMASRKLRQRATMREQSLRAIWAESAAAVLFLTELGNYLHTEVIGNSWRTFERWAYGSKAASSAQSADTRPSSSDASRPSTATSSPLRPRPSAKTDPEGESVDTPQTDPEMIANAHRQYLSTLLESLLLNKTSYTRSLRAFLVRVDQTVALVGRLHAVQRNLDLQDEGVDDGFAEKYAQEEAQIYNELDIAREKMQSATKDVTDQLRSIDDSKTSSFDSQDAQAKTGFKPWVGGGVDRLLARVTEQEMVREG